MARMVRTAPMPLLIALALAALVVIHAALSWRMPGPTIMDNELGYLANARVLAGLDSTPLHPIFTPTNYMGYSLLLVPLYWLRLPPEAVYHSALVINALLGAGAALLGYSTARTAFGIAPKRALVAGILVGLYPAVLLNGSFAWAENLLFVVVLLMMYLAHRMVAAAGLGVVVAFAATAAVLPLTHPRMLAPAGVACVLFIALAVRRRMDIALALIGFGTLAALVIVGVIANRALMPHIYGDRAAGAVESRLDSYTAILTDAGLFGDAILRIVGGIWYLGAGSAGLVLAGVIVLVLAAAGRNPLGDQRPAVRWAAGFILTASAASAVTSAATTAAGAGRIDYLFYGRYLEAWVPALLLPAVCLVLVGARRVVWRIWGGGILLTAVAGAVVYLGNDPEEFRTWDIGGASVLSILAPSWTAFPYAGGFRFVLATVVALAVGALLLLVAWSGRRWVASLLIVAAFVASAAIAQTRYVTKQSEAVTGLASLYDRPELDGVRDLSYDMAAQAGPTPATLTGPLLQFHLPGVQFHLFNSEAGQLPDRGVVIAQEGWPDAEELGARLVATEPYADQALWLLPDLGRAPSS